MNRNENKQLQHEPTGYEAPSSRTNRQDVTPEDDFQSEPPEGKSNTAMIIAIVAAVIVVLGAAGFLGYLFFFSDNNKKADDSSQKSSAATQPAAETVAETQPPTAKKEVKIVTMPDIEGLSEADAYLALHAADIRFKVSREYSDEAEQNTVISQNPAADVSFPRTETAMIVISKGKEKEIHTSPTKPKTTKPAESSEDDSEEATSSSARSGDYLLPTADSAYLDESDLSDLNRERLNLALNEIFARHGRRFSDASIRAYFESKSWYHGTVSPDDFDMNVLNQFELYNLNLISGYQEDLGYR